MISSRLLPSSSELAEIAALSFVTSEGEEEEEVVADA